MDAQCKQQHQFRPLWHTPLFYSVPYHAPKLYSLVLWSPQEQEQGLSESMNCTTAPLPFPGHTEALTYHYLSKQRTMPASKGPSRLSLGTFTTVLWARETERVSMSPLSGYAAPGTTWANLANLVLGKIERLLWKLARYPTSEKFLLHHPLRALAGGDT